MRETWHECTLADLLVTPWGAALGVSRTESGRVVGYPAPWRLWLHMPSKPRARPVAVCTSLEHVTGERCVALTDVELALILAAHDEGAFDGEQLLEVLRARLAAMGERRVKALRWGDVCEHAGVDPWQVVERSTRSLGASLGALGLEAVRVEVRGADERSEARAA